MMRESGREKRRRRRRDEREYITCDINVYFRNTILTNLK
jgi:hypothetical protein